MSPRRKGKPSPHVRQDAQGRRVIQVTKPEQRARDLVERFGLERARTIAERRVAMTSGDYFMRHWQEVAMWLESLERDRIADAATAAGDDMAPDILTELPPEA